MDRHPLSCKRINLCLCGSSDTPTALRSPCTMISDVSIPEMKIFKGRGICPNWGRRDWWLNTKYDRSESTSTGRPAFGSRIASKIIQRVPFLHPWRPWKDGTGRNHRSHNKGSALGCRRKHQMLTSFRNFHVGWLWIQGENGVYSPTSFSFRTQRLLCWEYVTFACQLTQDQWPMHLIHEFADVYISTSPSMNRTAENFYVPGEVWGLCWVWLPSPWLSKND